MGYVPALGGQLAPNNFEMCEIHLSIAGRVHRQIKDLPPGTPVPWTGRACAVLERLLSPG
jgi:hypothetical protein